MSIAAAKKVVEEAGSIQRTRALLEVRRTSVIRKLDTMVVEGAREGLCELAEAGRETPSKRPTRSRVLITRRTHIQVRGFSKRQGGGPNPGISGRNRVGGESTMLKRLTLVLAVIVCAAGFVGWGEGVSGATAVPSNLRIQQMLGALGYLPLNF